MDLATTSTDPHRPADTNSGGDPDLLPLEQELLDEYAKLVGNLDSVALPHCEQLLHLSTR